MKEEGNVLLGKKLIRGTWVFSIVVWIVILAMRRIKVPLPEGVDLSFLPGVHALLNTSAAVCLVLALLAVRKKNIPLHRRFVSLAMTFSGVFLLSYVTYHLTTPETSYGGEGALKVVYYLLLISHIILAGISLPFILKTWALGFTGQVTRHRRHARIIFPVWLYVALTGPLCYLMLSPYY